MVPVSALRPARGDPVRRRGVRRRTCYGLAYEAQREDETSRLARRADAIRDRLGWEAGILNPDGWKPKGMHWRTFWRLKEEHYRLKGGALGAWAKRLGMLDNIGS